MSQVLLIAGTQGLFGFDPGGHSDWWREGSPFIQALEAHGHTRVSSDPFSWTGDLDGLVGRHQDWEAAGNALRWWWGTHPPVDSVVAHSHALQVLAYAQVSVPVLITVGSPVRYDLLDAYRRLSTQIKHWIHLYSNSDWWQVLGELRDGGGWTVRRTITWASNVFLPGRSHTGLLDPTLWSTIKAWDWL